MQEKTINWTRHPGKKKENQKEFNTYHSSHQHKWNQRQNQQPGIPPPIRKYRNSINLRDQTLRQQQNQHQRRQMDRNKANLRDLITATGLVILLKLDSNRGLISSCVTLKFDEWHRKTVRHLFYIISSFVNHFKSINEFKLELQSGNAEFGSKLVSFCPTWPWNLIDDLEKQ